MSGEIAPRHDSQEIERDVPPEVLKRLVTRGELEQVTAATGTVLYVPQSLDE